MLQPKRVKYRKAQRGRMKGTAHRGATLAFGLQIYADSPSTDDIVARTRQMIAERFSSELFPELKPAFV